MTEAVRLRITLLDLDPEPWREIEVPLSMSFKRLHDAIQAAFQWRNAHLWEFDVDGRRYGELIDDDFGGEPVIKAGTARLSTLRDAGTTAFLYTYDMGDNWEHHVEVVDLFTADSGVRLPRFLGGEWRAPPEDIGGPPGFEMFLEAMADAKHPEHDEMVEWHGGPFDAADMAKPAIEAAFGRLAKSRGGTR